MVTKHGVFYLFKMILKIDFDSHKIGGINSWTSFSTE